MCVDENERLDIPLRERPLMRHMHNIAGGYRGELGPSDEQRKENAR